jgi:hypothetical protein
MSKELHGYAPDFDTTVAALERFWRIRLPESLVRLYRNFEHPLLAPCEFYSLRSLASGAGRFYGMTPQFLPFGQLVGEGGAYGLYVTPQTEAGALPVVYWDEDEMFLRPVASDFDAFLRFCVILGRYEADELETDECGCAGEARDRVDLARLVGIPDCLLTRPVPRNELELHTRILDSDPRSAWSLCHLGCVRRSRSDPDRALDFFYRAGEAADWFGDPSYLAADVWREREKFDRAVSGWWAVVQRLLPLCTRTWEWDLGEEHPEADIYEVAADCLAQYAEYAAREVRDSPLWSVVTQEDPYAPGLRESLGDELLARGDAAGAEREYLNALSLCIWEAGEQSERLYDALLSCYVRMDRQRDADLVRHDRALPAG